MVHVHVLMNRVLDRVIADGFQLQRRIFVPETNSHSQDILPTTPHETSVDDGNKHRPLVDAKKEIDEIFDSKWSNEGESGIRVTRKRRVGPGAEDIRKKAVNVASTNPEKEVKEWFIERSHKEVQMWDPNSQTKPSIMNNSKRYK